MNATIKWGVLGSARIAVNKVIPAMKMGSLSEIYGIASRDITKARSVACQLDIPNYYGSYEALLDDPNIDAVYIPLPNHMHVEYAEKSIKAGKHVLCEKPLAMTTEDIKRLIELRDKHGVQVSEAFMITTHPQWLEALKVVERGDLGKLEAIQGFFSYFGKDPEDIRNVPEFGGGGMYDIGCYQVLASRLFFKEEPSRVMALLKYDEEYKVDTLASVILDFPSGQATFTVGIQMVPYQRVQLFGTKKRLEIEIPFNAPNDRPCRFFLDDGDLSAENMEVREVDVCNQYTVQGDLFSEAILKKQSLTLSLEESLHNMATIDAIFRSAQSGCWETPTI